MDKQRVYSELEAKWTEQIASEGFRYDPYGQVALAEESETGAVAGEHAWHCLHEGLSHDSDAGLTHNRARDLHPSTGTFTRRDPLGYVDGMGLYRYVSSNPTHWVDPHGLRPEALPSAEEVSGLIRQLGANAPKERERAQAMLRPLVLMDPETAAAMRKRHKELQTTAVGRDEEAFNRISVLLN